MVGWEDGKMKRNKEKWAPNEVNLKHIEIYAVHLRDYLYGFYQRKVRTEYIVASNETCVPLIGEQSEA